MFVESIIWSMAENTTPSFDKELVRYRNTISRLVSLAERERYLKPFYVKKKSGGKRRIVPATKDLVYVQSILASWFVKTFGGSADYCYTGKGIIPAIKPHQGAKTALVVDLKDAFDHVTKEKIYKLLERRFRKMSKEVRLLIATLLTYEGTTPQGCVSTPYVFNAVVDPMDKDLLAILGNFPLRAYTRYADNMCFSFDKPVNLWAVDRAVAKIISMHDFQVSWSAGFEHMPISYLGTHVYEDRLELDPDKLDAYVLLLNEALSSPTPEVYRKQILGILTWVSQVYKTTNPEKLSPEDRAKLAYFIGLFQQDFGKGRGTPELLERLVTSFHNSRMF